MGQSYPLPITAAMVTPANPNHAKPRYNSMTDWAGGVSAGEDAGLPVAANEPFNSASVALANSSGGVNEADYGPRNLNAKRTAANLTAGTVGVADMTRPRGYYLPSQPWLANNPTLAAPTVVSLTPNTAVASATGVP